MPLQLSVPKPETDQSTKILHARLGLRQAAEADLLQGAPGKVRVWSTNP